MSPSKMAAVALCAVLTASGCAKLGYMSVQIDNVTFDVPRDYLVSGSIPWLPAAQSQALRFVVNPTAEVRDQHMVSIEPVSITCASAEAAATRTLSNAECRWSAFLMAEALLSGITCNLQKEVTFLRRASSHLNQLVYASRLVPINT
jgi:hypothetical protein